jgi:excisionase family DNA binding protein
MSEQALEARYFGYTEAAAYIGVSVGTLRRMAESGKLKTYKVGERLVRFDRLELDRFVQGSAVTATENYGATD